MVLSYCLTENINLWSTFDTLCYHMRYIKQPHICFDEQTHLPLITGVLQGCVLNPFSVKQDTIFAFTTRLFSVANRQWRAFQRETYTCQGFVSRKWVVTTANKKIKGQSKHKE